LNKHFSFIELVSTFPLVLRIEYLAMKKIIHIVAFLFCVSRAFSNTGEPSGEILLIKVARFYPNPASNFVNFEFKTIDKSHTLQIYNFLGKKLVNLPVANNKITIPLDGFFRGLYVFQLRDAEGNIVDSGKFQVVK